MRRLVTAAGFSLAFLVVNDGTLGAQSTTARRQNHDHHDSGAPEQLGTITWRTSAAPAAHAQFIRGVLYMHNFHYPEAIQAFQAAQKRDAGDVMSYWGEAMAHTHAVWNEQDTTAARSALRRLAPTRAARLARARTGRERAWLDAAETLYDGDAPKARRDTMYAAAMERLHAADPRDPEAATFFALALLGLNQGQRDTVAYSRAYAIAESVFVAYPNHPGAAHYLIHAVDDPDHARLGLRAAEHYSRIAPSAGHAQHMTSHIFMALGMWSDVVAANERAQAANPFLSGHVVSWLFYGLLQQGRYTDAERWLDSMVAQAKGAKAGARRAGSMQAAAEMSAAWNAGTQRWSDRAALVRVDTTDTDATVALLGTGLGAIARGERMLADSMLAGIVAARTADSLRLATAGVVQPEDVTWQGLARIREHTLRAMILRAAGKKDTALALLRAAAAIDRTLPVEFGPPNTFKPPHEAAGELLLEMRRFPEAENEFRLALERTPKRSASLLGFARSARAQSKTADAARRYAELAAIWQRADAGLPDVAEARAGARR